MTVPAPHPTRTQRVRRPLTDAELDAVLGRVDAATGSTELLTVVLAYLFDTLLADVGESRADYGPQRRLDPTTLAIPAPQWEAICAAVTNRAQAWGTSAQLALELVNLMPSSYPDPSATVPASPGRRDYRPEVLELHVSRAAADTIAAIEAHLAALAAYYGPASAEHREAQASWHRQLAALFTSAHGPAVTVGRDGPLSLVVTAGGLTFGIVFHGRRRACTTPGCHALTSDGPRPAGGGEPAWWPAYPGAALVEHAHVPAYPLDAPRPGTWSLHS